MGTKQQDKATAAIASRYWLPNHPWYYVAQVPGEGGKDWGYTTDHKLAKPLPIYWQRRFSSDCRHVGAAFNLLPIGDARATGEE